MKRKEPKAQESSVTLVVSADKPGARISPTMWGIFFEDINFGADGGLYAELVKNRSFEFPDNMMGWLRILKPGSAGYMYIEKHPGNPVNAHYLRLKVREIGQGFGISNEGFRGMGIRQGVDYRFSLHARQTEGKPITLRIEVVDANGHKLMEDRITGFGKDWQTHTVMLTASATELKARMNINVEEGNGTLDIDMVSLFPTDTWKNRENGLRADLVQMLADMKPGFLRFPGGCIVEGRTLARRYQWKTTVGDPVERRLIVNRWNTEFAHRLTPDYYQSFGLGFYEFFLLAEDIGAEPMPIVNCGMACQFNTGQFVPMDELGPYVQDMLDLIEFANGPTDSEWGRLRADMGHPEPFNMKMIGVGNEQWGPQYIERYKIFAKAIRDKYPDMQLIVATGSDATIFPNGRAEIDYLWEQYRRMENIDIVDEHFYRNPDWFLQNVGFYDNYDRVGPKIFVGEYGAQSVGVASPDNRNNWHCALYEAAFMTGLERNADIVIMSCYAPLFGHLDAWQWTPDMIWFDNLNAYGSVNYYVQQAFSTNRGDVVLPVRLTGAPAIADQQPGFCASAVRDDQAGEVILKVVNTKAKPDGVTIRIEGANRLKSTGTAITLSGKLADENSLDNPTRIAPVISDVDGVDTEFAYTFRPYSITVLRLGLNEGRS